MGLNPVDFSHEIIVEVYLKSLVAEFAHYISVSKIKFELSRIDGVHRICIKGLKCFTSGTKQKFNYTFVLQVIK